MTSAFLKHHFLISPPFFVSLFLSNLNDDSLKNFIKINEALKSNTARQIRMCFLCHKYNDPMDYGDNTVQHAVSIEKIFNEFFLNAKSKLRDCKLSDSQKWGDEEVSAR